MTYSSGEMVQTVRDQGIQGDSKPMARGVSGVIKRGVAGRTVGEPPEVDARAQIRREIVGEVRDVVEEAVERIGEQGILGTLLKEVVAAAGLSGRAAGAVVGVLVVVIAGILAVASVVAQVRLLAGAVVVAGVVAGVLAYYYISETLQHLDSSDQERSRRSQAGLT